MTDEMLDFARLVHIMRQMAHDMRGPLGVVSVTSDMFVQGGYGELSPKQERAAKRLQRASGRAITLLDDIMAYVKAEAQQLPLDIGVFDPRMLAADAQKVVLPEAQAKNLSFCLVNEENVPPKLWGDAALIRRIVLALLWNAIAFSERGEITLRSGWDAALSIWTIQVSDEGSGIAPVNISHIFDLFWRQGEQPQNLTSGCGVGLAMARALARLMDGQLTLEKTGPQGSVFCLRLPLPSEFPEPPTNSQPDTNS